MAVRISKDKENSDLINVYKNGLAHQFEVLNKVKQKLQNWNSHTLKSKQIGTIFSPNSPSKKVENMQNKNIESMGKLHYYKKYMNTQIFQKAMKKNKLNN